VSRSIKLEEKYLSIVTDIIREKLPDAEIWAFGSRVNGSARNYSDLDLLLNNSELIPAETMIKIREELSDSDLPIKVDVLDQYDLDEGFLKIINKEKILLQG